MWVLHKGDRKTLINLNRFDQVLCSHKSLIFQRQTKDGHSMVLNFEDEEEAQQAFTYLIEAIKRDDKLVHL